MVIKKIIKLKSRLILKLFIKNNHKGVCFTFKIILRVDCMKKIFLLQANSELYKNNKSLKCKT